MNPILRILLVYLLAALILIFPFKSFCFDYDVSWISLNSKESILVITIDNCKTKITVKNQDLEAFQKDNVSLMKAVKEAIKRSNNGCT